MARSARMAQAVLAAVALSLVASACGGGVRPPQELSADSESTDSAAEDSAPETTFRPTPPVTLPSGTVPPTLPTGTLPTGTVAPTLPTGTSPTVPANPGSVPVTVPVPGPNPSAALPNWLGLGTRVTWYSAAASIAQSRFSITEDPSCSAGGPGCYSDPTTGKVYRKSDEGPLAQDQPTAAGDGFTQIDVTAVDGTRLALTVNMYVVDRTFDGFGWTPVGGTVLDGVSVPGAWVDPAELEQAARDGIGGVLVLLGTYQFGTVAVPSISFTTGLGTERYQSHTYDRETGILLSANSSTGGPASSVVINGIPESTTPNTQLTMTRLVDVRDRVLPGLGGRLPEWVGRTSEMHYAGTYNWTNPMDPSSGNFTYEMQQGVTLQALSAQVASYGVRTLVPGLGLDTRGVGVAGPAGVYWWDPQALQAMRSGQVLDQDPITGEQLTVAFRGAAGNGVEVVTVESRMPGVATRSTYDMTGLLVSFEASLGSMGTTISLQLTGTA